ncbi:MAG: cytochrome c oxidase subunit II [Verrucomicrobiaceae bacterium]|nr:cytochrome c oxidase subunit II [Verrucomicrobiaceae bacterium]
MNHWIKGLSSYAADVDGLFWLVTALIGFWFIVAQAVVFYFSFRYRRKNNPKAAYITGKSWREMGWVMGPVILVVMCDGWIDVATASVWKNIKEDLPAADHKVDVTGQQWAWTFRHEGPDGKLDTPDDIVTVDDLHLVVNKTVHLNLQSKDVLHSFCIPVMRFKQDTIPGRSITGWVKPTATGKYDVQCTQICGIGHGYMAARVTVQTQEEYDAWMKAQGASAVMPPAASAAPTGAGAPSAAPAAAPTPAPAPATPAPAPAPQK